MDDDDIHSVNRISYPYAIYARHRKNKKKYNRFDFDTKYTLYITTHIIEIEKRRPQNMDIIVIAIGVRDKHCNINKNKYL